jgi:2'-5' RNA ligase
VRLFVAIELDRGVIDAAAAAVQALRRRALELAPRARLTWTSPDRMHVTLAFLGSVDAATADAAVDRFRAPIDRAPFQMTVEGLGAFPAAGPPRVIWAAVDKGREDVGAVQQAAAARLAGLNIERDDRPFHPHVTLARVREPAGLRTSALLEGRRGLHLGTTRAEAITLFESRPSPRGPTYVARQRAFLSR